VTACSGRHVVNRAATALRLAATTLLRSQTYLGAQYRRFRGKLGAPKAITAMAHTSRVGGTLPFVSSWSVRLRVAELPERPPVESGGPFVAAVTPGYFEIAGTSLVAGRGFTAEDRAGAEMVTVVNASMARLYWPGRSTRSSRRSCTRGG